ESRLFGDARQRGQKERRRRIDAGRRLMMLVEHDLDAFLLGDLPLVDVAVVKRGALPRIVDAVRQTDADRFVFFRRRQIGVGRLAEMPRSHRVPPARAPPSRKANNTRANSSGCSTCGACPASAIVVTRALGMSLA